MTYTFLYLLAAVVLALALGYKLVAGIRRYQVSGFRLYLVGHGLWILIFLVFILLFMLADLKVLDLSIPPIMLLLALVLPSLPQALLEARFQKNSPALWNAWAERATQARQSNWLDRILLPRSVQNDLD